MTNFEINNAFELDETPFGQVIWDNTDIEAACEDMGYDFFEEDIAAIRKACTTGVYTIADAMAEAGWQYIRNAITAHMREKEAFDRRAREEELYDRRHQ